jgi:hypothetical protein
MLVTQGDVRELKHAMIHKQVVKWSGQEPDPDDAWHLQMVAVHALSGAIFLART